jgi:hypothetical protein
LRKPEGTIINKINAFNEGAIKRYFQNLESVMEANIYNEDKTGISTVKISRSILGLKTQTQVRAATSWGCGKYTFS